MLMLPYFHIFETVGSHVVMKLSALGAGCPLLTGRFLVLISVRGCVDPRVIVQLEGLGQMKNPVTLLGIKLVAFWLVA
jgi:hypothetical protein